jgi:hypothetical protein
MEDKESFADVSPKPMGKSVGECLALCNRDSVANIVSSVPFHTFAFRSFNYFGDFMIPRATELMTKISEICPKALVFDINANSNTTDHSRNCCEELMSLDFAKKKIRLLKNRRYGYPLDS